MIAHKKYHNRLLSHNYIHTVSVVVVVVAIAVVGVHLLAASHAQSTYVASRADSGSLTAPATVVPTCSGSSDGTCVQFGAPLAIHVSGDKLVNGQGKTIRLLGVDASGTEDACILNDGLSWGASNTQTEDTASAAALLTWHVNAVRIPLNEDCWLGINGAPLAYSGTNYQTAIENWVNTLNKAGIITILDLHWSAPGTTVANRQWPLPDADHTPTFWSQVATAFKSNPAVIYDLFNEPYSPTATPTAANWACWLNGCADQTEGTVTYTSAGMQQLVTTIRQTGAAQPIMVGGLEAASDPCGLNDVGGNKGVCTEFANMPTDPDKQLIVSLHNYGQADASDNATSTMNTETGWNDVLQGSKTYSIPFVTGELGEHDCSHSYIDSYMDWADQNDVSYLTWSWEVNYGTTCNPLKLLASYDGTPSPNSPEAADYKAHLLSINP